MSNYALELSPNYVFLAHHGILGQKWGKKNGPPYPLDFSKLSAKERAEAKKETIDKGDVETAAAHRNYDYYTNKEIDDLITRFNINQRLKQTVASLKESDIKRGMNKAEKIARTIGTVANITGKVGDLSQAYSKIRKALDEVDGIDKKNAEKNSDKFKKSYDKKKFDDMLKNPDKYSDKEWVDANNRYKEITNMKKNIEIEEDRVISRAEKKAEKIRKDAEQNKKDFDNFLKEYAEGVKFEREMSSMSKKSNFSGYERVEGEVIDNDTYNRYASAGNSFINRYLLEDKRR